MTTNTDLQKIVSESNLPVTESEALLQQVQDVADMAAEWETKAKELIVTDASQTELMEKARIGRLALRDKRVRLEKLRKELKDKYFRTGQAIDKIARYLRELIEPIEQHLERQEKFVELKEKAIKDAKQKEIERRMEEERIAEEKQKAEELQKARLDNERLRKEAEEKDRQLQAEQKRAAAEKKRLEDEAWEAQGRAEAEIEKARKAEEAKKKAQSQLRTEKKETVAILTDFERLLEFVRKVADQHFGNEYPILAPIVEEAKELYKSIIYKKERTNAS